MTFFISLANQCSVQLCADNDACNSIFLMKLFLGKRACTFDFSGAGQS